MSIAADQFPRLLAEHAIERCAAGLYRTSDRCTARSRCPRGSAAVGAASTR